MQRVNKIFTNLQIGLIISIFFIGIFFRFYGLGMTPSGLSNDEVDIGYDAYSILKTGKDQWGEAQPAPYLKGFGDYRPSLYTYLVIPSVAVFDLNAYAVRFPAALIGSLTILLVGVLSYLLWKKPWISITSMFFLAVNPWHVGMSRIGIESTVGVFIAALALIFFISGLRRAKLLYLSAIVFALLVYTYAAYTIFAPILITISLIAFRKEISRKNIAIALAIFVAVLLPLIIFGGLKTAGTRSSQVNLTRDSGTLNVVNDQRGECQKMISPIICKIFVNKQSIFIVKFATNYISHFSPELLAINGTSTQYSTLPQRGLLHLVEYIAFILGVVVLLLEKGKSNTLLLLWIILSPIPDSITGGGHYSRYLLLLPAVQLAAGFSLQFLIEKIQSKKLLLLFPLGFLLYEAVFFGLTYFSYFRIFYARNTMSGYQEAMEYIKTEKDNYEKIVISSRVNDTKQYAYYLFFAKYDPGLYQSGKTKELTMESDNWIRVKRIENIYFLNKIPDNINLQKTLFLAAPKEVPRRVNVIREIKDLKGDVLFVVFTPKVVTR